MSEGLPSFTSTEDALNKDKDMKNLEKAFAERMHGKLGKVNRFDMFGNYGPYPGYYEDMRILSVFHDIVLNFEIRAAIGSLVDPSGLDILEVLAAAGDMNMSSG